MATSIGVANRPSPTLLVLTLPAVTNQLQLATFDQSSERRMIGRVVGDLTSFASTEMKHLAQRQGYPERADRQVPDRLDELTPFLPADTQPLLATP